MTHDLDQLAREAQERAYAPYSNYRVGAALETVEGRVYVGCNVENSSYSVTCCAERVALFAAIADGADKFTRMVVSASGKTPYPCGACRQALAEFAPGLSLTVINGGSERRTYTLDELLPHPFVLGRE